MFLMYMYSWIMVWVKLITLPYCRLLKMSTLERVLNCVLHLMCNLSISRSHWTFLKMKFKSVGGRSFPIITLFRWVYAMLLRCYETFNCVYNFQQIIKQHVDHYAAVGQACSLQLCIKWTQHQETPKVLMHKVELKGPLFRTSTTTTTTTTTRFVLSYRCKNFAICLSENLFSQTVSIEYDLSASYMYLQWLCLATDTSSIYLTSSKGPFKPLSILKPCIG